MRITLEPTEEENKTSEHALPKVSIEIPGDHHNLETLIDSLVIPALEAMTFVGVKEYLNDYEAD